MSSSSSSSISQVLSLVRQGYSRAEIAARLRRTPQNISGLLHGHGHADEYEKLAWARSLRYFNAQHPGLFATCSLPDRLILPQPNIYRCSKALGFVPPSGYFLPSGDRLPLNAHRYCLACVAALQDPSVVISPQARPKVGHLTYRRTTSLVLGALSSPALTLSSIAQKNGICTIRLYDTARKLCTALGVATPGGMVKGKGRQGQGHNWNALIKFLRKEKPDDLSPESYADLVHRTVTTQPLLQANLQRFIQIADIQPDSYTAKRRLAQLLEPPFRSGRDRFLGVLDRLSTEDRQLSARLSGVMAPVEVSGFRMAQPVLQVAS